MMCQLEGRVASSSDLTAVRSVESDVSIFGLPTKHRHFVAKTARRLDPLGAPLRTVCVEEAKRVVIAFVANSLKFSSQVRKTPLLRQVVRLGLVVLWFLGVSMLLLLFLVFFRYSDFPLPLIWPAHGASGSPHKLTKRLAVVNLGVFT